MREPSQYEAPSCESIGGDFWFPENLPGRKESSIEDTKYAVSICNRCPHKRECAEWGIQKEYFGIWGGLTLRERQKIRDKRGIILKKEDDVA